MAATSVGDLDEAGEQHARPSCQRAPTYCRAMAATAARARVAARLAVSRWARCSRTHRRGAGDPTFRRDPRRRDLARHPHARRAPATLRVEPRRPTASVTGDGLGRAAPSGCSSRCRAMLGAVRRPDRVRAAAPAARDLATPPPLAGERDRPGDGVAGADDHRAEGHRAGGASAASARMVHRFGERAPGPPSEPDPPVRLWVQPSARAAARDPVVGVAAAARRRRAVAPDPARRPGGAVARAGRPGAAGRVRPAAAHAARRRGLDAAPRCGPGRSATPTRSASATTTSPRTSATR